MTVGNDQIFEDTIDRFGKIESDPNKNVDEEEVKEDEEKVEEEPKKEKEAPAEPDPEPAEENKDVEEEVKEEIDFVSDTELARLIDAWELIGSQDDDPHVRTMADEKVEELKQLLDAGRASAEESKEAKEE